MTGQWLEYHTERLTIIKTTIEDSLRKYETVPMAEAFVGSAKGHAKGQGTTDLRNLMNQIEALATQLERYRPAIAGGLLYLAENPGAKLKDRLKAA